MPGEFRELAEHACVGLDGDRYTVLAGWGPDATYWFSDAARPGPVEQRWARDDDGVWSLSEP